LKRQAAGLGDDGIGRIRNYFQRLRARLHVRFLFLGFCASRLAASARTALGSEWTHGHGNQSDFSTAAVGVELAERHPLRRESA
jgi:hypothetical protein